MNKQSTAENRGPGIKSDCNAELELLTYGGTQITLENKFYFCQTLCTLLNVIVTQAVPHHSIVKRFGREDHIFKASD